MISVLITYNDDKQIEKVRGIVNPFLTFKFININTKKGRKDGRALKNSFGAVKDPFIMCYNNGTPIKGFWSEASDDVIEDCLIYLHEFKNLGE